MTSNNNSRRKVSIFPQTKTIAFLHTYNDDAGIERRSLRFNELDAEYDRQLRHLKNIARRARSRFLKFNQPHRTKDESGSLRCPAQTRLEKKRQCVAES